MTVIREQQIFTLPLEAIAVYLSGRRIRVEEESIRDDVEKDPVMYSVRVREVFVILWWSCVCVCSSEHKFKGKNRHYSWCSEEATSMY